MLTTKRIVLLVAVMATLLTGALAGTCICSSMVTWSNCPHGGACYGFCSRHGGVRYWGGPNRRMDLADVLFLAADALFYGPK